MFMTDVMNRAARRAVGRVVAGRVNVRVRNRIAVVPMEHVETYFTHEIASEGKWRNDVPIIILRPGVDCGTADSGWWPKTLARIRETRQRKGTIPVTISMGGSGDIELDVGLVDITVFFQMPPGKLSPLLKNKSEADRFLDENLRHLDSVCAGGLHDQMIIATAPHIFHSNGSLLLHYHNLVIGLRQEVRGNMDILGPLDIDPLLKALSKSGPLSIIGGMKAQTLCY
jgi:hypothetical protein